MPEGDTIHTVARVMAPDVVGQAIASLVVDGLAQPALAGAVVVACRAVGKHLVLDLAADAAREAEGDARGRYVLRVHLGMKGSWHRYRPGEPWPRTAHRARVELATARWVFVCFGPKDVDLVSRLAPRPDVVAHLGPDLLGETFDLAEVLRRARRPDRAALALGELVMTQTVAAGIGNVYKSECLFLERLDPWAATGSIPDARLEALYLRARALMRDNVERGGWRTTTARDASGRAPDRALRTWVYRRAGRPCRTCGTLVRSALQGAMARRTYWCPTCQTASAPPDDMKAP